MKFKAKTTSSVQQHLYQFLVPDISGQKPLPCCQFFKYRARLVQFLHIVGIQIQIKHGSAFIVLIVHSTVLTNVTIFLEMGINASWNRFWLIGQGKCDSFGKRCVAPA